MKWTLHFQGEGKSNPSVFCIELLIPLSFMHIKTLLAQKPKKKMTSVLLHEWLQSAKSRGRECSPCPQQPLQSRDCLPPRRTHSFLEGRLQTAAPCLNVSGQASKRVFDISRTELCSPCAPWALAKCFSARPILLTLSGQFLLVPSPLLSPREAKIIIHQLFQNTALTPWKL